MFCQFDVDNRFSGLWWFMTRRPGPCSRLISRILQKNNERNRDLVENDDGSITIWFGPKVPKGKEANWIQTLPDKGWFICLRLYGPLEPWFKQTWRPGEIEPVN